MSELNRKKVNRLLGSTSQYAHLYVYGYDPENADTRKQAWERLLADENSHIENINFRIIDNLRKKKSSSGDIPVEDVDFKILEKLNHLIRLIMKSHDNFTQLNSYNVVRSIHIQWSLGHKPTEKNLTTMNILYDRVKEYE